MGNMACHNLLQINQLPVGTNTLLGLNLNYCIKSSTTTKTTAKTFERMTEDVRRIYAFSQSPPDDADYIPTLYIKSDYRFKPASIEIEKALFNFRTAIKSEQLQLNKRRKPTRNLSFGKWNLIQKFRWNDDYIIVPGDKNLGPCILDRKIYINKGCLEHLGNETNYQSISKERAFTNQRGLQYQFRDFLGKYRPRREEEDPVDHTTISKAEETFLRRSINKYPDKLARFRMTAKVHKTPYKMRPIVCCVGTFVNDWSKWLDYWLQQLKHLVPTYVKDSQQVLDDVKLINLPPNAKLFTCDAHSMYNNIKTSHAIQVITWWLTDLDEQGLLPALFPLEAVIEAMTIIMTNNIFEFGNMYFLQLLGTAMGTSSAVMWATLYYAYHEVHTLIPKHGGNLLYFRRFIDDIFGIWIGNSTTDWSAFCNDVNTFGVLTWDIYDQELSSSVDFLDLTLFIEGSKISSKTFQKKMNLYLYLPSSSAHPISCLKGTIYGLLSRYHAQNTYRDDYLYFVRLLYRRLLARGWERKLLREFFLESSSRIEERSRRPCNSTTPPPPEIKDEERLFIHVEYHPDDISRKRIQELYSKHCAELFQDKLDIKRPTIAYSRPKNIGDYVTTAKLHQAPGQTASIIMGEYKNGLNPS